MPLEPADVVLNAMNCNPLIGMVRLARNPEVDNKTRAALYKDLAGYVYTKKVEVTTNQGLEMETYEERLKRIRASVDCPESTLPDDQDDTNDGDYDNVSGD